MGWLARSSRVASREVILREEGLRVITAGGKVRAILT
jgi:hypothetical protein